MPVQTQATIFLADAGMTPRFDAGNTGSNPVGFYLKSMVLDKCL